MTYKFDRTELLPGDIIQTRGFTFFNHGIRAILGSYTNHTAMIVLKGGSFYIGEAVTPCSRLTSLEEYEHFMDSGDQIVRVLRVKEASYEQRLSVANLFVETKLKLPYPLGVLRLWCMRFCNNLPWKVRGDWCTRIVWDAWHAVVPDVLMRPPDKDSPKGKRKKNPTPRTVENRLMAGVLEDVTDSCVMLRA